jgi:Eco29kI restriction endonuclease
MEPANMDSPAFDRNEHIYRNDAFVELLKDAVRFFNGTPIHELSPLEAFTGTDVYAIYCIGKTSPYQKYGELNRLAYNHPIYVGKAVPKGWRQSRISDDSSSTSSELYSRLREHSRSISSTSELDRTELDPTGLQLSDFKCRFVIFEGDASDMIGTIEAALIKLHRPLWNTTLDGFGNHDPGKGRYQQARSDWDVIHPGRAWAEKCQGAANDRDTILERIEAHLLRLGAA